MSSPVALAAPKVDPQNAACRSGPTKRQARSEEALL